MSAADEYQRVLLDLSWPVEDAIEAAQALAADPGVRAAVEREARAEAEKELRHRELHHFETEQMLADAEARVAAAEREFAERAAQAIEARRDGERVEHLVIPPGSIAEAWDAAIRIVRDLMPRKDGE